MKTLFKYLAVALFSFAVGFSFYGCGERYSVNESDASWMPPGATDGAYHHSFTFILGPPCYRYEYTISEEDFVSYLKSIGHSPSEIEDSVYVPRYLRRFVRQEDYRHAGEIDLDRYDAATGVTISDGLVWQYSFDDQSSIYAFDRMLSRAFIEINTR